MEFLDNAEYLLNEFVDMLWYSKIFAVAIGVAFLVVFAGMVIINSNLHEALSNQKVLQDEIRDLKGLIKGGTGNGTNDERSHEGDHSGS